MHVTRCGAAAAAQAPRSRDVVVIIIAITSISPITSSSAFTHQPEALFTEAFVVIGYVIVNVIMNGIVAGADIVVIIVVHIITVIDFVTIIIIITCDIVQTDRELSPVKWKWSCESVPR